MASGKSFIQALQEYTPGESLLDTLERGVDYIDIATVDDKKTMRTVFRELIAAIRRERTWLVQQRAEINNRAARVRALSAAMREMHVTKLTDGDLTIELGPKEGA